MKIKILNKNNSQEYVVDEGAVITENFNETLDSAKISISHFVDGELDIEPFDEVVLTDDRFDSPKYFCVDDYSQVKVGLDEEYYYNYEINLFSQTKLLEGIILPNISITPTFIESSRRDISQYLKKYLEDYGPKVRTNGEWVSKWELSSNITNITRTARFDKIICPELQWNVPTLREVFTTLMMVDDCVPVLRNNVIDFLDLTKKGKSIDVKQRRTIRYDERVEEFSYTTPTIYSGTFTISLNLGEKISEPTGVEITSVDGVLTITSFDEDSGVVNYTYRKLSLEQTTHDIKIRFTTQVYYLASVEDLTVNYIQKSQSSNNYASEIRMNMQNVLQTSTPNIKNTVTTCENLSFISDGNIVNDSNYYLKTQFPILKINHLWICFYGTWQNTGSKVPVYLKADLCNLRTSRDTVGEYFSIVKESKEWNSLRPLFNLSQVGVFNYAGFTNSLLIPDSGKIEKAQKFRSLCLGYTRGGNTITGFNDETKIFLLNSRKRTSMFCILAMAFECIKTVNESYYAPIDWGLNVSSGEIDEGFNSFYSPTFQIEYETTANSSFSASKDDYPNNERVIVDNQTNSWVDAWTQGNLEYQKANRIGNKAIVLNQRVVNESDIIKISDTYNEDYIVYQTTYEYYNNYIGVSAQATKNYVLRDYFTGINSKIRTWVNAQDEAFERHDLFKYYVELSFEPKKEYSDVVIEENSDFLSKYFSSSLNLQIDFQHEFEIPKPISNCYFKLEEDSEDVYVMDCISRLIGNSIVFTTGFNDNWVFMKKLVPGDSQDEVSENLFNVPVEKTIIRDLTSYDLLTPPEIAVWGNLSNGGLPLKTIPYVDVFGENDYIYFGFLESIFISGKDIVNHDVITHIRAKEHYLFNLTKPKYEESDLESKALFFNKSTFLKDNKEIQKFSLQFEFCRDNQDIIFTKDFIALQRAIRENIDLSEGTYTFKYGNNKEGKNLIDIQNVSRQGIHSALQSIRITFKHNDVDLTENDYLYVYYENKLLLIVKHTGDNSKQTTLFINILKSRNPNTYAKNSNNEWIKVGNINEYDD